MPITGVPATIAAIYTTNAGQSIPNLTNTIVDFEDKVQDTHNAVTTGAAWKFTAPEAGYYQVNGVVLFTATATWADGEEARFELVVNGATEVFLDYQDHHGSASGIYMLIGGGGLVYLDANDYLDIRVYQASGAALTLHADAHHNRISVVKV